MLFLPSSAHKGIQAALRELAGASVAVAANEPDYRFTCWALSYSAHVGEPIAPDDTQALENLAGYVVRNPSSLQRLVCLDGQQAVLYRSRMNPALDRNFEAMNPLEWLARLSDHIPVAGQHRPDPRLRELYRLLQ